MKAMVKRNATVFILLFCFGQLAAQTFEKIISTGNFNIGVPYLSIDNEANTYISAQSTLGMNNSLQFSQESFLFKLDSKGGLIQNAFISPASLNSGWVDSINHIFITAQNLTSDSIELIGSVRSDAPTQFSKIRIMLDKNFNVGTYRTFSTVNDSFPAFYGVLRDGGQKVNFGYLRNVNNGLSFGFLSDCYAKRCKNVLLFSDSKQMWSSSIHQLLKDKRGGFYKFATEYSGPPSFLIEGPTIIKLDSNFNFLKRSRLTVPIRHSSEFNKLSFAGINSQWISDSTFIVAAAQTNNIDTTKGDVHLFVYDTSLTRVNYKRFVTTDTNIVSQPNTLKYDTLTSSFYFATLQTLEEGTGIFFYGRQTTYRLMRFDKDLNVIWDKQYNTGATVSLDVMEVDQYGQITMAGGYEDSLTRENGNTRNIYVLRVDSNGNFIRTDLLDKIIPKRDYMVYPNPASTNVIFKKFNRFEPYNVEIFDQAGRRVEEFDWLENERNHSIENLQPGIYIYSITDKEGRTSSGKLVKTSD